MIIKIISGALILFSAFMGIRHGWNGLNIKPGDKGPFVNFQEKLHLGQGTLKAFAVLTIIGGILLLPPQTFVFANFLNAGLFLFLIIRFLMIREIRPALTEVPFLLIPLLLVYLKHPLSGV